MIKTKPLPPQKHLLECFLYEENTGRIFWRKRPLNHFVTSHEWKRWNTRHAGNEAVAHVMKTGHKRVFLDGQGYLVHRLIWKMLKGKDPEGIVDHKDRKAARNILDNLRDVNDSFSVVNRGKFKNNTSGYTGVVWSRQHKAWRVGLHVNKKRIELGLHKTLEAAISARQTGERLHHGEFAPQ